MENSVLHTKKTGIHRIEINDAKFDADFTIHLCLPTSNFSWEADTKDEPV